MKAAGEPGLRTRDLVVMMGGSQPLHPGSTPGVCTSIDATLVRCFGLWRVVHSTRWVRRGRKGRLPYETPCQSAGQVVFRERGAVNVTMC